MTWRNQTELWPLLVHRLWWVRGAHGEIEVVASCGHETCGFFHKKGRCLSCVLNSKIQEESKLMIFKDMPHVESLMDVVESKTLKNYFGAFLAKVKTIQNKDKAASKAAAKKQSRNKWFRKRSQRRNQARRSQRWRWRHRKLLPQKNQTKKSAPKKVVAKRTYPRFTQCPTRCLCWPSRGQVL